MIADNKREVELLAKEMHREFVRWWNTEGVKYQTKGIRADAAPWEQLSPETREGSLHIAKWLLTRYSMIAFAQELNVAKFESNENRKLIYRFVELPDAHRREIARKLKLLTCNEISKLDGVELNNAIVKAAVDKGKKDEFVEMVNEIYYSANDS